MGHDISGYNKKGEEIAYARYSMSNYNAKLLYQVFESNDCHAGVSGNGDDVEFTVLQVERAKTRYNKLTDNDFDGDVKYEKEKLETFIDNCLSIARDEGKVRIFFE